MEPSSPTEPVGEVIWIGGRLDKTSACLRFTGGDLDLDSISRLLSFMPTRVHRRGELLRSGRTRYLPSVWLLDQVLNDLRVWEKLTALSRGGVFCGLHLKAWNRGFSLSPRLMERLAKRHLTLEFDIYCEAEQDEEAAWDAAGMRAAERELGAGL